MLHFINNIGHIMSSRVIYTCSVHCWYKLRTYKMDRGRKVGSATALSAVHYWQMHTSKARSWKYCEGLCGLERSFVAKHKRSCSFLSRAGL